ncbi:MAG: hypothetical protein ACRDQA_21885 [Nocardioidaceae bacterium]
MVTVDFEDLKHRTGHGTNVDTGGQLSAAAVRRLACDAESTSS